MVSGYSSRLSNGDLGATIASLERTRQQLLDGSPGSIKRHCVHQNELTSLMDPSRMFCDLGATIASLERTRQQLLDGRPTSIKRHYVHQE